MMTFRSFLPHPVITMTTTILKDMDNQLGETASYFHTTCAEQAK